MRVPSSAAQGLLHGPIKLAHQQLSHAALRLRCYHDSKWEGWCQSFRSDDIG